MDTSACTAITSLPIAIIASSSVFLLRPAIATRAPSSCKRFAAASPMPLLPPFTTVSFPWSLFMLFSVLYWNLTENCSAAVAPPLLALSGFRYLDDHRNNRLHHSEWHFPERRSFVA